MVPDLVKGGIRAVLDAAPSRRRFLRGAAGIGGALVVGAVLPMRAFGTTAGDGALGPAEPRPNAFVRIAPDDTVTVLVKHLDMGQGSMTGLTTIVAEELDADWSRMRGAFAPADVTLYANHILGFQGTGGSTAVANSWDELRMAGAAARVMLIGAAAVRWSVPASEITVEKGVVTHASSGRNARFGELAEDAARQPVPETVTLKDPSAYTLIGDPELHRLDHAIKTDGSALFALDIRRPGRLVAVVARAPRFGATLNAVDDTQARKVPGVVDVVTIPNGVAVLARNTWTAIKGREALAIEWDERGAETRGTDEILAEYRALARTPGAPAARKGDAEAALAGAERIVEAEYSFPYLAHAPMEPLSATIELTADGGCEIWAGSQAQTLEQQTVAAILGCTPEQVKINTLWAGGSFGRRATPDADYMAEAAAVAKAHAAKGGKAPIHLVWTREDDIRGGRYRPMVVHRMRAGLDGNGAVVAWEQRIVGQSIMGATPFASLAVRNGIDPTSVEGASDMEYRVPNLAVDLHSPTSPVTILWWRSVGHTHTAYAKEAFIDELAAAAGKDPVAMRLEMLEGHPRLQAVLRLAAEKADWGTPLPDGKARGIAVHKSFGTFVAHVAEVAVGDGGRVKVDRVVCAVDCGTVVNPDVVRAQIEGGTGWGIGHALRNAVTLTGGVVDQSNFDTYEPLRLSDMPAVEVHIIPSTERPTGAGEPGVPSAAPAVANAIFKATGKPIRSLPFTTAGMA